MSAITANRQRHASQCGMTLIELMVSMVIGLFLTWGAIQVYLQSKGNYRAAEITTRLQENARFALETLEPDLRMAGFWGRHRETALVAPPTGIAVTCGGANVAAWALDLTTPVDAVDDNYGLLCAAFTTARPGSDVLILRHAGERSAEQAGKVQIRSSLAAARVFDDGVIPAGFLPDGTSDTYDLEVHAYYVDNSSSFNPGVPSLRRLTLVAGGVIEDQEMITGVENLQVQFGLDMNGDGTVERYVDPNGLLPGARIVAVRLWMLVRSEESPSTVFQDTHVYQPLDANAGPITPGGPLYPPQFQRMEMTRTVFLRNQTGT